MLTSHVPLWPQPSVPEAAKQVEQEVQEAEKRQQDTLRRQSAEYTKETLTTAAALAKFGQVGPRTPIPYRFFSVLDMFIIIFLILQIYIHTYTYIYVYHLVLLDLRQPRRPSK